MWWPVGDTCTSGALYQHDALYLQVSHARKKTTNLLGCPEISMSMHAMKTYTAYHYAAFKLRKSHVKYFIYEFNNLRLLIEQGTVFN